jgi:hypothetical protein
MGRTIHFDEEIGYDTRKVGVTIPVTLRHDTATLDVETKLDTGSTNCIFQRYVGETLALNIESGDRILVSTATGSFVAFGHFVTLEVAGHAFDSMVYFAADPAIKRNVLGQQGFLNRVALGLIDNEGKLFLNLYQ